MSRQSPISSADLVQKRKKAQASFDRRLSAYAIAAATIGVATVPATPAKAEVVYTPANITIVRGTLPIDLNADGLNDFVLIDDFYTEPHSKFPLLGGKRLVIGGSVSASVIPLNREAAVLGSGVTIGSSRSFRNVHDPRVVMAWAQSRYVGSTGTCCVAFYGNWENVKNQYLGLKFQINGQSHFGWARVTVKSFVDPDNHVGRINATLSGYAYETNPNQSITAGDTGSSATNSSEITPRGTLGQLARGAAGSNKPANH